jgi:hypothetical protein
MYTGKNDFLQQKQNKGPFIINVTREKENYFRVITEMNTRYEY